MKISVENFGKTKDGAQISLFTMTNENGMSVAVTDFGVNIVKVLVPDCDGVVDDVVLGFDNAEGYFVNGSFFGATIGRSANRIANAKFSIDGKTYNLDVNDGPNNLHSDFANGFHKRLWAADVCENGVKFTLSSPDMDMGFPGNLDVSVTVSLSEDNELSLHYEGVCDQNSMLNMTNHSYFNLNGHKSGKILDTELTLLCSKYTPVVEGAIPTGELADVVGTVFDFTSPKKIGLQIDNNEEQLTLVKGYDHNFVIDGYDKSVRKIASATTGKRTMEVYTDLPGVQFYAGNCIAPVAGKDGASYDVRCGFCLETQYYPNSINEEGFYSPALAAGQKYDTTTIYKFV